MDSSRVGVEIQFADGKRLVDAIYAGPIRQATDGVPERYTFQQAMDRIGDVFTKRILRSAQERVIRSHFRRWA
jgi:hypothetical protein